ncbi:type II toxin-antitoxin system death-on-curing family toxin [Clostridium tyrobutyricum]|jgi:death-on-curing protein|uniref:type II toxin-antitoxin system death-on-curing family toxin n=1 Tax=Clostridium tyrobutyricum TaxID=1519 RepID=UPI0002D43E77|nr:type II toxin-antitoxin system death-on-curing family toxin [Clostridium tyrobutyricum]MBR9649496.1 type II toxin-antitoxin system death-on-curing family toxin [Clostridium tyrobutyricum]MBV4432654.1 type II toxin-antitoxin system death-on-curing family toxin [Clostridium tyrobutyricum]MBV4438673.1 type II toxin-antitoxin system death-on-curing family toxin [Clostridium tyrobutyricum]MBV4450349.1 type II toxin-antitoxin system death-on-curing family toxin [Clostridium tyrobutyricum]QCH29486
MKYITIKYILKLHDKLIEATGGTNGVRDLEILKSSVENSKVTFYGQELYPTIESKCANICFNIIKNHAFVDGNKRTGIYVMLVLLEYNNIKIGFSQNELVNFAVDIASDKIGQKGIVNWIKSHEKGTC